MKVLLDECVPRKFKREITGHHCLTSPEAGFAGLRNGSLLRAAESSGFDVLITVDQGIQHQQKLKDSRISVIIIQAKSNRFADVALFTNKCLEVLASIGQGEHRMIR